ncbi:MAG: glycosyltransferase family 4 protein [Verrucomicrobiota bacterium]
MRIGILTSHPIQYQAPYFRALAQVVDLHVYFAHRPTPEQQGIGFGKIFEWDVDLLSGYTHTFLHNVSRHPGSDSFGGCDTPEIAEIIATNKEQGATSENEKGGKLQSSSLKPQSGSQFDAFIVSGWYLKSYWQAVRACRRNKIPVLVRGDSQLLTPRSRLKQLVKEVVYRITLRQFDGFLVVGQRNREYLAHYAVPADKMFFAPHFVDNDWFRGKAEIARKQREEMRKEWGADEETLVILFVGKFISKKRPGDLLQAMIRLRDTTVLTPTRSTEERFPLQGERVEVRANQKSKFLAVFVGSGELESELREMASRENLRVHFAGFKNQTELPSYYTAADVLVLPSDGGETWGLVVNEAMACGLPAIVSDAVGCAPDLIETGRTGFSYPVGNVDQLAERLSAFIHLHNENQEYFSHSLRRKSDAFSLNVAVRGTIAAIESLTVEIQAK